MLVWHVQVLRSVTRTLTPCLGTLHMHHWDLGHRIQVAGAAMSAECDSRRLNPTNYLPMATQPAAVRPFAAKPVRASRPDASEPEPVCTVQMWEFKESNLRSYRQCMRKVYGARVDVDPTIKIRHSAGSHSGHPTIEPYATCHRPQTGFNSPNPGFAICCVEHTTALPDESVSCSRTTTHGRGAARSTFSQSSA